ncbi:MAG TPA: HAD family hydrolase [Methanocorpusculum sp.]|nr:HAD family hydrolase [Methanocorpusculum sp.]
MQTLLFTPFKAVLFDMDNTLFDFVSAMRRGCGAASEYLGVGSGSELLSYYLRWKYHFEDHTNLQDFMIANNCFSVDSYLEAVKIFNDAMLSDLRPYEGIETVLETLKSCGYKLAVVSDAFSYTAKLRLEKTNLASFFDAGIYYDITGCKKPNFMPFEYALGELGVKPYEAVFVGDSIRRDIEPSMYLGMTSIYAKYGDRNFFDAQADKFPRKILTAETPMDILRFICRK